MILTTPELAYLERFAFIHSACYAGTESEIAKLHFEGSLVGFDFSEEPEYRTHEYLMKLCPHLDLALFSCAEVSREEAQALQNRAVSMGTKYVLATRGLDGQDFFDGRRHYQGKAELSKSVDTMGAGDSFYTAFVSTLLKNGWRKGEELTTDMITRAFQKAARFSAEICGINGSFDYGAEIV
jgi:fructoselysine 6-kinase